jgi:DNA invertase Pin-like site-specific DNA recombinase
MMVKRVALYARVSTDGQSTENQVMELREAARRNGWEIVGEYVDKGISGAKGREHRPQFAGLWKAVMRKEVDIVAAWSVDRLGRSLPNLLAFLSDIQAKNVGLYLDRQGVDTTTPGGKALFQMMGVFAEFERAMIQERVKSGLARARAQGKTLGRPRVSEEIERRVKAIHAQGKGMQKIAKEVGIGVGTVKRIIDASKAA